MALQTALTKRLGLRYPVIAAPLGRGSTPDFLAALAREGAMGFVALMHMLEPEVRQILSGYIAAAGAGNRFGVNLTLIVDQTRRLDAALEAGCGVVSFWEGDITPYARRAKDAGATVFWTVSRPDDAARAAKGAILSYRTLDQRKIEQANKSAYVRYWHKADMG